ncbi:MAG: ABC transporter permease [Chloroflexi bacterium]|nr:MAG: ABC transporter permease [Chloroflexota bacterium]
MNYADAAQPLASEARRSFGLRAFRRLLRRPLAVIAVVIIVFVYATGLLAPAVAPYGFNEAEFGHGFAAPNVDHPLGTDRLGRDLLSRAMWSAQTTVIVSVAVVGTGGLLIGLSLGMLAGYAGGRTDNLVMRAGEILSSVPTILLVIIIRATLQDRWTDLFHNIEDLTHFPGLVSSGAPSIVLIFGALSIFSWFGMARLVRSQVLALRESAYILAARASGASVWRILFGHLLPNLTNLVIVVVTLSLGSAALAEIGLTFLGIGVQPPHPSFGTMIFEGSGLSNIRNHPQLMLVPAVVVGLLLLSFNLLGDALTDILSPRRR